MTMKVDTGEELLIITPSDTVEGLIFRGKYHLENRTIRERFSSYVPPVGTWEFRLNNIPEETLSLEEIAISQQVDGWSVADLGHLLVFGEKFPDVQKNNLIIALGSAFTLDEHLRGIPILFSYGAGCTGRSLDLFTLFLEEKFSTKLQRPFVRSLAVRRVV